jgi:hypothetical protein
MHGVQGGLAFPAIVGASESAYLAGSQECNM